ncbi:hypothetical protein C0995_016550 [Termitomyces sp. Mi166|nr:hypothetical protein C0995_016550 [Termitomyces sp. Mi166\
MSTSLGKSIKLPLDPTLYSLDADELVFFQEQTGIRDEQELKQHIVAVQEKAYEISRLPPYHKALALLKKYPDALFLDIACCFGNDIRKIVADGWPVKNAIASDLHRAYWKYGHELFRSTPETFPAAFIQGDAFDSTIISPREPFYAPEEPTLLDLPLKSLTSLTPLQGRLNVCHASSFFHLFDEAGQLQLARQLATLLSPATGSVIFGSHGGKQEKGFIASAGRSMFCHSPESWKELWDGQVFKKGTVKVEAGLHQIERDDTMAVPGVYFSLCATAKTMITRPSAMSAAGTEKPRARKATAASTVGSCSLKKEFDDCIKDALMLEKYDI